MLATHQKMLMVRNSMIIVLFCLISGVFLRGQSDEGENYFDFSLLGGLNFSQLDGDQLSGFSRIGFRGGLEVGAPISDNTSWKVGILLDQKGSSTGIINNGLLKRYIHLNYLTIPLTYEFGSWKDPSVDINRIHVSFGLGISRLFGVSSSNLDVDNALDDFKDWDLAGLTAVTYSFGPKSSIRLGLERSFLKIYQPPSQSISGFQSYLFNISWLVHLSR